MSVCRLINGLKQERHRAEAVVAGDHCGLLVFHPTVVEILASGG